MRTETTAGLTFDEPSHTYRFDGTILPSVTQVLQSWSPLSKIDRSMFAAAGQLGTEVHLATALDDQGELDPDSLSDEVRPYLEAWRKFKREHKFESVWIERPLYCAKYGFAGTPDRIGGDRRALDFPRLIDIKTGGHDPTHPVQTAGYVVAAEMRPGTARACVYLSADGTYEYDQHRGSRDWSIFLCALTYWKWRQQFNI